MVHLFNWKCCYYHQKGAKWLYGRINLYDSHVRFKPDAGKLAMKSFTIDLRSIAEIRRRTTNLFFNAIVISERGLHQHWFSSFENVYEVLNIVEHFWKGALTCSLHGVDSSKNREKSKNELVEIAYESQSTLISAAAKLHSQGEQIRDAVRKMDLIHSDLQIAEQMVNNMQSWFHSWNVKCQNPSLTRGQAFSILVAKSKQESHTPSKLILAAKSVEIYDLKNKTLFSFNPNDLGNTLVHSPYDLTFVQRSFGKPDKKAHVISTELPNLLQCIEAVYGKQLIYEDPPLRNDDDDDDDDDIVETASYQPGLSVSQNSCSSFGSVGHNPNHTLLPNSSHVAENISCGATIQKEKQLTDSDANELSGVLQNMKGMALDIQREQELQNQQLDLLAISVERADSKINKEDKAIKHLLR